MARTTKTVRLRALKSFSGMHAGDVSSGELTPRVQGWINAGLAEVVTDGPNQARPGGAEQDTDERVPAGADSGVAAGGQPGEGFGAGSYGASA